MIVLLVLSMFAASSLAYFQGFKFSFTNDTELEVFRRQTLIMNCSSYEEIEWLIPDDSNALIKHVSNYEASIFINQTTKCDSGDYVCRSKYNWNQFARIHINVRGLKYSFKHKDRITLQFGEKLNATCSDEGGVKWSIPPDSSVLIEKISVFEESVVSNGSVPFDTGRYICESKSNPGERAWFSIYVESNGYVRIKKP
ncbi:uncharacterized protein LOC135840259 [Planococcus citri]|uniref:uncharacterized protein LOC135840259 n=1 Tax=Planococcus citri TaxID=170843 RepID=UPI0031F761D6